VTAQVGDRLQEGYAVSIEESVVGAVYRAGVGRYVNDLLDDGEAHGDATRRSGLRSAYVEPLLRDGEPAGVLAISWHTVKRADPSKLSSLVGLLATETASAIERADLVSELASTARTDQLTGVRNRRAWDEELPRELARARRVGAPVCVAMIDIDHFKAYNDRHGHLAGDRLLRTAAAGWSRRLRTTDLMARYGGEEFCVLLPGCSEEIGERLLDLLRRDMPDRATCSAGVAEWDGHESPEELVGRADRALYAAKRGGRDRVATAGATAIRQPA
jgi:diguanylate cyclase (GGDEF)-like protein